MRDTGLLRSARNDGLEVFPRSRNLLYATAMGLTALDIVVILLVGAGALFGWLRGFVCEVLSLLAWFLAIVALRYLYAPVHDLLVRPVGTGASVVAFVLVFGLVFLGGKLASRRLGSRVRQSVVGPVDRVLGAGFGALKGLIGATLLFLGDQPRLRHDLGPRRDPARMDRPVAHLSLAQVERRHRRRPGRGAARAGAGRAHPTAISRTANDRDPPARHDGAGEARLRARRSEAGDDVCLRPDRLQSRPYRQCPARGGVRRARPPAPPRLWRGQPRLCPQRHRRRRQDHRGGAAWKASSLR